MVWFYASRPHFADHLAPVWRFGSIRYGWMPALWDADLKAGWITPDDLYVVAAYDDMVKVRNRGAKRVVLMEHGAGQSYSNRHTSYVGGKGRERCPLVLVPNQQALDRHRWAYGDRVPVEMVGCPKLDEWVARPPKPRADPPHVVITYHWRCGVAREAGTVWDDYGWDAIHALVGMRDAGEIELSVHAHPRIYSDVEAAGPGTLCVPMIRDFAEVVASADLFVADNTSAMFEFAALDRPVVVMNSPRWKPVTLHGGRFWDWAAVGPNVNGPEELPSRVKYALIGQKHTVDARRAVVDLVYPYRGEATRRAVEAIRDVEVGHA